MDDMMQEWQTFEHSPEEGDETPERDNNETEGETEYPFADDESGTVNTDSPMLSDEGMADSMESPDVGDVELSAGDPAEDSSGSNGEEPEYSNLFSGRPVSQDPGGTLVPGSSEFSSEEVAFPDLPPVADVSSMNDEYPTEGSANEGLENTQENIDSLFTAEEVAPLELDPEGDELEEEGESEIDSFTSDRVDEISAVTAGPGSSDSGMQVSTTPIVLEPSAEMNTKKIALILSGGGARGAFQVGAEMYARQVKGYHWDIIAGVSVGAMNGAMLSMHRFTRLLEIWETISNEQVFRGGFNLPSVIKLLFGEKSFYSNKPLERMMKQEFEAGKIIDDLHVGAVSLITGEYIQFTKDFLELPAAILASASIPVIWPPVDISPEHLAMVDGGVRNINPVGDVLDLEPDEIVIINCSKERPPLVPNAADNVLSIGMRTLDIMQNEIFVNDIKEFLSINALVKEASDQGAVLHHARTGRILKYYPCSVIEPDIELGETLDFSQASVQTSLKAGVRCARAVLGRP